MLARGAACDTCRARKVKCDASRPFCSPCLKSARGDQSLAQTKCKYEGTSVAAARAEAAANAAASGNGNGQPKKRRKKASAADEDGAGVEGNKRLRQDDGIASQVPSPEQYWQHQAPAALPPPPPSAYSQSAYPSSNPYSQPVPPPPASSQYPPYPPQQHQQHHIAQYPQIPPPPPAPSAATGGPPRHPAVVDELTARVAQLERQLRLQADAHAASASAAPALPFPSSSVAPPVPNTELPHTRSPSFPYSGTSTAGGAPNGSAGGYTLPPLSAAFPPAPGSSAGSSSGAFPPPFGVSALGSGPGSPSARSRPPTSSSRTPLASFSSLVEAAGVGLGESSSGGNAAGVGAGLDGRGSGLSLSPFLRAEQAESNLRGEPNGGAPSQGPVSGLRHLVGAAEQEQQQQTQQDPGWGSTPSSATASTPAVEPVSATTGTSSTTPSYDLPDVNLTPELYQLLHPQYPSSLPPIQCLTHLVTVFFARATVPAAMLSKVTVLGALQLGPGDAAGRWPDEALLHAICAWAAPLVSVDALAGVEASAGATGEALGLDLAGGEDGSAATAKLKARKARYWEREGDASPRAYHYRLAKEGVERAMSRDIGEGCQHPDAGAGLRAEDSGAARVRVKRRARDLYQVLQATILLCQLAYQSASFADLWFLAGFATRLCTPLGLNHLDPWDFERGVCGPGGEDWGVRVRFVERAEVLPPPETLEEHYRRTVTFWLAFAVDRFASASTDWSTSIDEKDISTHLPCTATVPMPGLRIVHSTGQIPPLSISNPAVFEDTSAPVGSLGLYIKATILLGRVVNYLQRLPRARCADRGDSCEEIKARAKQSPDFVELDVALSKFKASHSNNFYQDAMGSQVDGFLASAYIVPHVATILLHEPFCDRLDQSPTSSLARCLAAAKCIVNSMFVLYQSSYDLGGCDPFLPFAWSVAGRALVRDWATRRRWAPQSPSALDEAESSRQLAEHSVKFMETCAKAGSGIAIANVNSLNRLLIDPDALLPFDGSEPWAVSAYLEDVSPA
ncbi:hypothetical protein JCM10207_001843 [Rhodosporidiobolus poonsookiae]